MHLESISVIYIYIYACYCQHAAWPNSANFKHPNAAFRLGISVKGGQKYWVHLVKGCADELLCCDSDLYGIYYGWLWVEFDPERSKVWHGNVLGVHKGRWVGLGWSYHSREKITKRIWNRGGGPIWKRSCRERTDSHSNIVSGAEKSDQEPYDVGIPQYAERVR